ncbi:MAG: hypothetical protein SFU83_03600 [Meiothermus sp.]|nr:hypothetical protein [Meiothermus sp.]
MSVLREQGGRQGDQLWLMFSGFSSRLSLPALSLLRPRFVYVLVLVRLGALPIPLVVFAPLGLVQLGLWVAARALERRPNPDRQAQEVIRNVRAGVGQLRLIPAFAMVEAGVGGKLLEQAEVGKYRLERVYVKVGLL